MPANFFVTIPHSGERVPDDCSWLKSLPETVLMADVDRFVDRLYGPALQALKIPCIKTDWHRYAADLNRLPEDVDAGSVQGHMNPVGRHRRGFHWQITTKKETLMKQPMTVKLHQSLVELIYEPFHQSVRNQYQIFREKTGAPVFHLDLHSMPSLGTSEHNDPGEARAEIVISDCKGKSSCPEFVDLVIAAYVRAGFRVAYNWPYFGGRVSEQYGHPERGQHAVQAELNRALYMSEESKQIFPDTKKISEKLGAALKYIHTNLPKINPSSRA